MKTSIRALAWGILCAVLVGCQTVITDKKMFLTESIKTDQSHITLLAQDDVWINDHGIIKIQQGSKYCYLQYDDLSAMGTSRGIKVYVHLLGPGNDCNSDTFLKGSLVTPIESFPSP